MTKFLPVISSPKDWPDNWKDLQTIDSLLRCSICGEFFKDTTFIPSCSHNYCSLCIRRYLCVDSKCPICGEGVQDVHLQNNRIIDEIVKSFVKIRNELLDAVEKDCSDNNNKSHVNKNAEVPAKGVRKKDGKKSGFFTAKSKTPPRQAKPSQKRHRKDSSASDKSSSSNEIWEPVSGRKKLKRSNLPDSSDSDELSVIEDPTPMKSPAARTLLGHLGKDEKTENKGEDLVDCPVCSQKIVETKINIHLDTCLTSRERKDNPRSTSSQSPRKQDQATSEKSSHVGANSFIPQVAKRKPLNKLVYTLLSNTDLKRKMKEHGLSIKGERQTLVKRHQEFTMMYNSECSKPKPKSVAEIVRLVEEGERKKSKAVESRDKLNFERDQTQEEIDKIKSEYMSQNQDVFTRLINDVKSRKNKAMNSGGENNKASSSKTKQSPSTSKQSFAQRLLLSDDDSNSSGADFEPTPKLTTTPRRQVRSSHRSSPSSQSSSTEKRITRSSAKKLEEIVEDVSDESRNTVGDEKECCSDDPADPIEPSAILPHAPSPSLLEDIHENESNSDAESSGSESILPPAFGESKQTRNTRPEIPEDYGNESEEIEF